MKKMTDSLVRWFTQIPLADPLDRKNAVIIQALLLFLATTIPVALALSIALSWDAFRNGIPWTLMVSLGLSSGVALVASYGIYTIRKGRFRTAVRLLLFALILTLAVNASTHGLQRQLPDQLAQMMALILSGLVLGRRALWTVLGLLACIVALGTAHDAFNVFASEPARALYNVPSTLFSYFLVAVLIDRTSLALRESLQESNARGAALELEIHEREKTHAQLIHSQKREITERMASGMAHDFNNIFAVIAGFSTQRHVDDGGTNGERIRQLEESLCAVEDTARRGMAVSRRLLNFNRSDLPQAERFDASAAIRELTPMLKQLLGPDIVLRLHGNGADAPVVFDRSQFELMLLNIASNARDAMQAGGYFDIGVYTDSALSTISLADSGGGMTDEVLEKAFEPFFSTKAVDAGTGLGLAVVAELVRCAGGAIRAESRLGSGTTITITLPHRVMV